MCDLTTCHCCIYMPKFAANACLATSDGWSNRVFEPTVSCTSVFGCEFLYQDFLPNFKAPSGCREGTKKPYNSRDEVVERKEVQFESLHYIFRNCGRRMILDLIMINQPGVSRSRPTSYVVVTDAIASISKSASRGMRDTSTNVLAGLCSPKNS